MSMTIEEIRTSVTMALCKSVITEDNSFIMNIEEDLTLQDIREASSNYLRSVLKNGLCENVQTEDMIEKELYVREHRRSIT